MAKVPGLVLQGARYYYRRVIPANLRAEFQKNEIWIALGTSDYNRACALAREAAVATDRQFADVRAGRAPQSQSAITRIVTSEDLQRVAKRYFWEREKQPRSVGEPNLTAEALGDYLDRLMPAPTIETDPNVLASVEQAAITVAENVFPEIVPVRRKVGTPLSTQNGIEAPSSKVWTDFLEMIRRAELEHVRRSLDRLNGDHGDRTHDPLFQDVTSFSPPMTGSSRQAVTVGELIDRFQADPRRSELTDSADKKYVLTFRALEEVVGRSFAVADITRAQCAEVQELLAAIPANMMKIKRFKGKSLKEAAALRKELGVDALSSSTVAVYTHSLSAFLTYAVDRGVLEHNPAARLTKGKGREQNLRHPLGAGSINQIFANLAGWSKGVHGVRIWAPLIALYSGMRLGEIVSLHFGEFIQMGDGTWAIQLRHSPERPLKTKGSERLVPLHPTLVELGFVDFAKKRHRKSDGLLFHDLDAGNHAARARKFQRHFATFQRNKAGIVESGLSFHSFRHTFRDAMREAGVPHDAVRALGGWARSSSVEDRYGQGTSPATLAKWMAQISYPDVDLSSIRDFVAANPIVRKRRRP